MNETKGPDTARQMLSYSRCASFLACRKAYYYSYVEGIVPRIDAPQLRRGTLVDRGMCAGIEAERDGAGPVECQLAAADKIAELGKEWLASEVVQSYAELAGPHVLEEAAELAAESQLIAVRALEFLGIGEGRWATLALPGIDGGPPQFGCQARVVMDTGSASLTTPNYHGHIDWVARDLETGHVWLVDFKTRKNIQGAESLDYDYQLPSYIVALRQMGVEIHGAAHLQIRAKCPEVPELLKARAKAPVKMSRKQITTDWATYRTALLAHNLDPNDYLDVRDKLKPFDVLTTIYRAPEELENIRRELNATGHAIGAFGLMLDTHYAVAPRRLHVMQCRTCNYQDLCLAELRGHDAEHVRELHYTNKDKK